MKIDTSLIDKRFKVRVLGRTENPQQLVYAALHQDYSEHFVYDELKWSEKNDYLESILEHPYDPSIALTEQLAGEIAVKRLLKGKTFHGGPLEHPQIVLNYGGFPHSVMQQLRTHRTGISFDVQSFRYSGKRIYDLGKNFKAAGDISQVEDVFYLRPIGEYTDREGSRYIYDEDWRNSDLVAAASAACKYFEDVSLGKSEEHARGLIPFDVRQNWVMSANLRTIFHLMDMRYKADAQLECQIAMLLTIPHIKEWCSVLWFWYENNRLSKGILAP